MITDNDILIYNQAREEEQKIKSKDLIIKIPQGNLLLEIMNEIEPNSMWENSKNEKIKEYSNDEIGKIGERLLERLLKRFPKSFKVEYDGDANTNTQDGIYDMKIYPLMKSLNKLLKPCRTEVKTATMGRSGEGFQYETFKENVCDKYILISITPNSEFLTIMDPSELYPIRSHYIFNRRLTIRKRTDVGKLTLSLTSLYKGIQNDNTIELCGASDEKINRFLEKHFNG
jgi:hypothetical protein